MFFLFFIVQNQTWKEDVFGLGKLLGEYCQGQAWSYIQFSSFSLQDRGRSDRVDFFHSGDLEHQSYIGKESSRKTHVKIVGHHLLLKIITIIKLGNLDNH